MSTLRDGKIRNARFGTAVGFLRFEAIEKTMQAGMQMPIKTRMLIEQVIEHARTTILSTFSTTYPTPPPPISNTKKKGKQKRAKMTWILT